LRAPIGGESQRFQDTDDVPLLESIATLRRVAAGLFDSGQLVQVENQSANLTKLAALVHPRCARAACKTPAQLLLLTYVKAVNQPWRRERSENA